MLHTISMENRSIRQKVVLAGPGLTLGQAVRAAGLKAQFFAKSAKAQQQKKTRLVMVTGDMRRHEF